MPRRILQGVVKTNKADKTVSVLVERKFEHPLYTKTVSKKNKFKAHDPENKCKEGEWVKIKESRPYSKEKTWEVLYE